jgi:hypothetical protein
MAYPLSFLANPKSLEGVPVVGQVLGGHGRPILAHSDQLSERLFGFYVTLRFPQNPHMSVTGSDVSDYL